VGPHAGWYSSNDADEGALFYGFQGRARLGRNFGFELSLDYRDNEQFHAGTIDLTRLKAEVMYIPITASLMIFVPVNTWLHPYGVAGIGWYYTITEYELFALGSAEIRKLLEDENNFEMGYHFGLGLEIPLSSNIAIHGDVRYLFLGTEIKSIREISTLDTDTKNSDGVMISGGLMLYL
jgi:opacity protein-like surface antigen